MKINRAIKAVITVFLAATIAGCQTEADVVSQNISKDAGEFKVVRRIVFYNGITDTYILTIEGLCQIDHAEKLSVTCKTDGEYKKHYLGLSDNVTYFAEQIKSSGSSSHHYKVIFRPQAIVPDIELKAGN